MSKAYYFEGKASPEVLKIIFKSRTKIYLASSKTEFKLINVSDKFYDTEEEKQKCLQMADDEFDRTIISTFWKQGYKLVKIQNE